MIYLYNGSQFNRLDLTNSKLLKSKIFYNFNFLPTSKMRPSPVEAAVSGL